jgi:hypothetical protein
MNRLIKNSLSSWSAILLCGLLSFSNSALGNVDLIDAGKSDSTIKMLVFPQSLRVLENGMSQTDELSAILSESKQIRKTLLKVDPARVAPAKVGAPVAGPITRDLLRKLANIYSDDVIFIFRRVWETKLNVEVNIRYQGLLYLAKQKKVLVLKENGQNIVLADSAKLRAEILKEMDADGLKILAKEARKTLHSHKFEKRQSAY